MNWILIRGLARSKEHWLDFPQLLQQELGGSVYCLDLPGVGGRAGEAAPVSISAYATDLHHQLEALQLEGEKTLIAVSLGAMIGLTWVEKYPHDFRQLVTINTSAGNLNPVHERMSMKAIQMIGKLFFSKNVFKRERAILELTTNLTDINEELVASWVEFDRRSPLTRATFIRQILAASTFRAPSALILRPLILVGEKDQLAHPNCSHTLARHLQAELRSHPEAGHDLALDDPQWIIEQIKSFT